MRDAFPELGIAGRLGVNTGGVVTGTEERLATGDAVNVAARLQQAANPGEVLVGAETLRLVRAAVEVGRERQLDLKGKAAPVRAYRLVAVTGELERSFASPMVGREHELARLRAVFGQALHDRSCQLFTVLGSAGVGKSRLAAELLAGLEARLVRGRCLSYGEGITYWPVVEILKQLDALPEGDAARPVRSLLGEAEEPASAEEIAWGFRKLLEQEAQLQPLVCVFDDLHWAEETLLDLVEHVADLARDAPILLLCMARPELLERRPSWGGGKWNATTVLLEPLNAAETETLLAELGAVPEELHDRVVQIAEGNPLFVEEMVALVRDSDGGQVEVPPTIHALLVARLDQLDPAERFVLERGSVEGRVFHRGAVAALGGGDPTVDQWLVALVRKELVRPERTELAGDDAYRFRHLLIRDATYEALPKAIRAELHARFAEWLEEHGRTLVELDEILGYHLEQVYRYRDELGALDDEVVAIGTRAASYLALVGRRAYDRGDAPAAAHLLSRAVSLPNASEAHRLQLLADLGQALYETGELVRAKEVFERAIVEAEAAGELGLAARARISQLTLRAQSDPSLDLDWLQRQTEVAIEQLEQASDALGLARAWLLMGSVVCNMRGQAAALGQCAQKAYGYARTCGAQRELADSLFWQALSAVFGPLPVDQAKKLCERILAESDRRLIEAAGRTCLAMLEAQQGHFKEAREKITAGRSVYRELGLPLLYGGSAIAEADIEFLAADLRAAERVLREGHDVLDAIGETGYLSTNASRLAEVLYRQNRLNEAERFTHVSEQAAAHDDLSSQIGWRSVRGMILGRRGDHSNALELARRAAELTRQTDYLNDRAATLLALAEVLTLAGNPTQALPITNEALGIYEQKGNLVMAQHTREQLDNLEQAAPVP
jgi:tetratricopeptide (TPR) repeat protein